ncbi:MAG: hypothetical protein NT126_08705 [Bacteroidetes bacterium]|nr:hypothetical protein [Bacteroidota bacterium]
MIQNLSIIDLIVAPILFILFYIVARSIKYRHIDKEPYYKYYISGLFVKVIGGIAVCFVYVFYYGGGDTTTYYHDNVTVTRLFLKDPSAAIRFSVYPMDNEILLSFDEDTDYPVFSYDKHAIYVDKITWPLSLLTFNSFIGQTMLLALLSFFAIWRLYKMFITEFPTMEKELAFAILFVPSVVFWGSGLLKDTLTLSAVAIFTSSFYRIIRLKEGYLANIIHMILASWILIKVKPYIFFALMPGTLIWFAGYELERFRNKVIRSAITPALIFLALFAGYLFLKNMGDVLGEYALDNVLTKAVSTQQDLKRDIYQGASFDIGEYDATISDIISKAPIAIISALFRPYLWESYNPGMIVSGLENFVILLFSIYLLLKLKVINFFRLLFKNHILFFSVSFSFFFAFSVGLTTSNFGSLVRYKIPAIPFFVVSLLITNYYYQEKKNAKKKEEGDALLSAGK